jgi:predicted short-subunit dehydrogenase-like oxidoreductase (DUF2520 family)
VIKRTPNTFVVGAGPVATALAGALRLGGVPVLGLWARSPAAARTASATAGVAGFSAAPPDLLLEADVVVLAVRDDAIAAVARTLIGSALVNRHHVLLHCSGVISAEEAFAGVKGEVRGTGTLHPLRAIPDGRAAMRALRGTVFGVEGDEAGRQTASALVAAVGGKPLELHGPQMAAYHAAAAVASNYLVVLLDLAAGLFARAGVEADNAVAALLPLVESTLGNIAERGTTAALTGPVRRGDAGTVARHVEVLADHPGDLALYRALGRRALEIARRAGAPEASLTELERLLADPQAATGGRVAVS